MTAAVVTAYIIAYALLRAKSFSESFTQAHSVYPHITEV